MTGYYGSAGQQAMARRAEALFRLVRDDVRLGWYGRNVVLADFNTGGLDLFEDLVRLQGATAAYRVPRADVDGVRGSLEDRGLRTDVFGFSCSADDTSPQLAAAILKNSSLPDDLSVTRLGAHSPDADLDDLAGVALDCGVLPPPASVLRGQSRNAVVLLARDAAGRPVATAAAVQNFHPDGPLNDLCWWGMLATRPDRRGERIALLLGAEAMVTMHREQGFARFMTGVRDDNLASARLCEKLGVVRSDYVMVIGMDPDAFTDARITK